MKKCPYCQEGIQEGAVKCKHCGEILQKDKYVHISHDKTRVISDYSGLPEYYQKVFSEFDKNNGKFKTKWNWAAFFWTIIWYPIKGMWLKALLMIVISFIFAGVPILFFWLYCGIVGNYDYYLLKVKGKQLW